jgi:hypothetical protein
MQTLAGWLAGTSLSQGLQRAIWLIILLQTIHILAIAMVLSSVAMVELRILGWKPAQSMTQTARRFLSWLWMGLVILAGTGTALVIAEPRRTLDNNPAFLLKMAMLAIAIAMTVAFQYSLARNASLWEKSASERKAIGALAILTFVVWLVVAMAGRWIAYVREG